MKKNILVIVHTNTWFTEMDRVADLLRQSTQFIPIVHFAYSYPTIDRDIQKLKAKGIQISTASKNEPVPLSKSFLARLIRFGHYWFERIFQVGRMWRFLVVKMGPLTSPFQGVLKSLEDVSYYKKLIHDSRASLVVMAGDLVGYNTPEIAKAARKMNKACVIVPSTMSDGTEQAEAYFFDPNFSAEKIFNKIAGWIWPKWKKQHKGKWLVRVPAAQIFARQLLKTDPPLPWISSSTRADAIAVESKAMRDYYTRCGIAQDLLKETGSLANDGMAKIQKNKESLKKNLYQELMLPPGKKMILTALPPDFLYMVGGRPECEFKTYLELTQFWIQTLAKADNFNVVISLHPSVDIEEFRYLEMANVRISKSSIIDLIPLCDIFVASVSSTIRWAITCAKPVINYDVYLYRYSDFSLVRGVVLLEKSEQYIETVKKINDASTGYLEFLGQEIQAEAPYWGNLDGCEGMRVLKLFEEEIAKKENVQLVF